jgi:hypothetical protein
MNLPDDCRELTLLRQLLSATARPSFAEAPQRK